MLSKREEAIHILDDSFIQRPKYKMQLIYTVKYQMWLRPVQFCEKWIASNISICDLIWRFRYIRAPDVPVLG